MNPATENASGLIECVMRNYAGSNSKEFKQFLVLYASFVCIKVPPAFASVVQNSQLRFVKLTSVDGSLFLIKPDSEIAIISRPDKNTRSMFFGREEVLR